MSFDNNSGWHLFSTWQIFAIIFLAFAMGSTIAYVVFSQQDFSYKEASIMTCDYANKLTNLINNQSMSLELFSNRSAPYTKLDELNCSRLSGELLQ